MKLLGFRIPFTKVTDQNTVTPIQAPYTIASRFGTIFEAFGGMWSQHLRMDNTQSLLAFSAVYACIRLISDDIAKIRLLLLREQGNGTWGQAESNAFSPLLRKPNRYQTRMQFFENWLISKLIWGNTYVLKERDARQVVVALYVLDAGRVKPLVTPDGDVFYEIQPDSLSGVGGVAIRLPASEVIHDRGKCLFHPLYGVPPLYACALSTTQGRKIQTNSSKFFENMSRPSGHLAAPGKLSDEEATRIKAQFESGFGGDNVGRILVTGSDMKFAPITVPADHAQLIEQLGWTVEDVCRAYGVPLYKVAAQKDVKVDAAMRQEYYDATLFPYMEAIELLLDDGLALPTDLDVKFDIEELLRMDPKSRFERYEVGVRSAVLTPNEARKSENLAPAKGGDTPYLQEQNWPLADLTEFHKQELKEKINPPAPPAPALPAPEEEAEEEAEEEMRALLARLKERLDA